MGAVEQMAERALSDGGLARFAALVRRCRSYRRFAQDDRIGADTLVGLVGVARLVASGANRQPLRYRVVSEPDECAAVFPTLRWAAALPDWDGPEPGERPSGYVVICDAGGGATARVDEGITAQTILLAATSAGFGGCMLHAFDIAALGRALGLAPDGPRPLMVVALGRPAEDVRLEELSDPEAPITYWRDADGTHHVPKRRLGDVLL